MFITSNIYSQIDNDYMMKKNKTNKKNSNKKQEKKIPAWWKFKIAVANLSQIIVEETKKKQFNQNYLISSKFKEL